jgi:hypothetical protein
LYGDVSPLASYYCAALIQASGWEKPAFDLLFLIFLAGGMGL